MSNQGEQIIDELNEGVLQLRDLIEIGDVRDLSAMIGNVRAPLIKNLAFNTNNACVQQALLTNSDIESFVAFIIQTVDAYSAAEIICNSFSYNAQKINSCRAPSSIVVLV